MSRNTSLFAGCRKHIQLCKMITRMLLLAVALFVVASCSQPGQGNAPTPTPTLAPSPTSVGSRSAPTPAGSTSSLQAIHMIDAHTGWAETSTSVLYTTNGWSTWKNVTPHQAALVDGGYVLSGQEAWIAEAGQQPGAIVSHTTDGGQTWQSATLSASVPLNPARMSFINNQDGWIEAETGGATGNDFEMIFRTTDGGKTWTAVSRTPDGGPSTIPATFPFTGHKTGLTFISASTGWATGPWLYITHDGGATWQAQTLPTVPGQVFAPPTFFNTRDGIVPATSQLFVTHDSGATWQSTSFLPEPSNLVTAFLDMQHGLVAASSGTTLYSTSDGGAHWAKITPVFTARITGFARLNFVSTEIGWALGYTPETASTLLFKTADGGQTWTQVPLATPSLLPATPKLTQQYEFTEQDSGRTVTYTVTTRFEIIFNQQQYPKKNLQLSCTPPEVLGSISNLPSVTPPLYAVRYEAVQPGLCTIRNGTFLLTVRIIALNE